PAQTLTDKEYQRMRDASLMIMREIGVDTGGSNIQFAVNPVDGDLVVIEMNPRVSRSSALASKATGFPIAKIAAQLAVGYTPDEVVAQIRERLRRPDPERLWHVADALRVGISVDTIYELTRLDRWFLNQMKDILAVEEELARGTHPLPAPRLREAKQLGFSDH